MCVARHRARNSAPYVSDALEAWLRVRLVDAPGAFRSDWMKIAVNPPITSSAEGTSPSNSRFRGLITPPSVASHPALHAGAAATLGLPAHRWRTAGGWRV